MLIYHNLPEGNGWLASAWKNQKMGFDQENTILRKDGEFHRFDQELWKKPMTKQPVGLSLSMTDGLLVEMERP